MKLRILGVWDLEVSSLFLGGLLTLVEELKIIGFKAKYSDFDICVIGDIKKDKNKDIFRVLYDLEGVKKIYYFQDREDFNAFVAKNSVIIWPKINKKKRIDYNYGTTKYVQKFYKTGYSIPYLTTNNNIKKWTKIFLKRRVFPKLPIVAHLKYNPSCRNCSNADFDAWFSFFYACEKYEVVFILVGSDRVDKRISKLKNVLIAKDSGSNLARDLSLVESSSFFMGMASGICNMAIFSDVPYIIFKDPDHHKDEMRQELGDKDRFIFATKYQKLLRVKQTDDRILEELNSFLNKLKTSKIHGKQ